MKTKIALLAGAAAALLTLGLSVGASIGDDGTNAVAERLSGDYGEPIVQRLVVPDRRASTAKKRKKPIVLHGTGSPVDIAAGEESIVALKCPKKYPVPISAGLETSIPGIFPGIITRSPDVKRAMTVGVSNETMTDGKWLPTAACMKGAKEA